MTEVKIQIESVRKPYGLPKAIYRYKATYNGEELGVWEAPGCSAARVLLQKGVSRDAVMVIYRGSTPSMRGTIGWWADRAVRETLTEGPMFVKWKPFDSAARERLDGVASSEIPDGDPESGR